MSLIKKRLLSMIMLVARIIVLFIEDILKQVGVLIVLDPFFLHSSSTTKKKKKESIYYFISRSLTKVKKQSMKSCTEVISTSLSKKSSSFSFSLFSLSNIPYHNHDLHQLSLYIYLSILLSVIYSLYSHLPLLYDYYDL
ncbi:uncharacterized protein BX664DRAFT_150258 [Halteromyces radiatus]|uniref:uncharacterized protein n=1 Tax=Halteromyces radiatus TaxID=101107 RepID=UPI00221EE471|nr:uncharacterized protein BX664DRAFT_150258 [Halteromyces radiatus]KAI8086092.1 hypothetical protein BX664DRAFT_150258 [Halteromyces radiatus]